MTTDADPAPATGGDAQLITAVRAGDSDAYAALYDRHHDAACRLARCLTRSPADADDLAAEAFTKLLTTLRDGGGPDLAFRPYLLTTVRNLFYDRARREQRVTVTADLSNYDSGVPWVDPAVEAEERTLVAQAFAKLPERWQAVLWHTEVEGEKPAAVASLLDLSPNGVAALAYRARERLRQNYLREHVVTRPPGEECRPTVDLLGGYVRGGLSQRDRAAVAAHLDDCDRCGGLLLELWDVNAGMREVLAPAILGTAAAAGYVGSSAGGGGVVSGARRLVRRRSVQVGAVAGVAVAGVAMAMALTAGTTPVPDRDPPLAAVPPSAGPDAPGPDAPGASTPPSSGPPASTVPGTTPDQTGDGDPAPAAGQDTGDPSPAGEREPAPGEQPAGEDPPAGDTTPPDEPEPEDPGDGGGQEQPGEDPPPGDEQEPDDDPCVDLSVLTLLEIKLCLGLLG